MSIFINKHSKVIVQGITGGEGTKHTASMLKAGANIVGGVNARRADETVEHVDANGNDVSLSVYGTVAEAMQETGANGSVMFVPPKFAKDAAMEAIEAEIELLVVTTAGISVQDTAEFFAASQATTGADGKSKTRITGPNCPGIITPDVTLAGITPASITGTGPIG